MTHRRMRMALTLACLVSLGSGARAAEDQPGARKPAPPAAQTTKAKATAAKIKARAKVKAAADAKLVDINSATKEQLAKIPGLNEAYGAADHRPPPVPHQGTPGDQQGPAGRRVLRHPAVRHCATARGQASGCPEGQGDEVGPLDAGTSREAGCHGPAGLRLRRRRIHGRGGGPRSGQLAHPEGRPSSQPVERGWNLDPTRLR